MTSRPLDREDLNRLATSPECPRRSSRLLLGPKARRIDGPRASSSRTYASTNSRSSIYDQDLRFFSHPTDPLLKKKKEKKTERRVARTPVAALTLDIIGCAEDRSRQAPTDHIRQIDP